MEIKKIHKISKDDIIGDLMSIDEFFNAHKAGAILPSDGMIGGIIIDNWLTNISIPIWGCYPISKSDMPYVVTTLLQLKKMKNADQIKVEWCNK